MKTFILFFISIINVFALNGQEVNDFISLSLEKFKNSKDSKIKVGFSPTEVKAKIGNPKAVESGFPNSTELIVVGSPDMSGQMNNSTWFYIFEPIEVKLPEIIFFVNGFLTNEQTFLAYRGNIDVYLYEKKLISPGMGEGYKITKNSKLEIVPLNREKTFSETTGGKPYKMTPLYCIIFDKGTQVVAATKAYFIK